MIQSYTQTLTLTMILKASSDELARGGRKMRQKSLISKAHLNTEGS